MSFYSDLAVDAAGLIEEFGQPMLLSRTVPGAYNPTTGSSAVSVASVVTATGLAFDYEFKNVDNKLIRQGDKQVYLSVSGLDMAPTIDDNLAFGGASYTVKSVKELSPAGIVVMYELNVG